MIEIHKSHERGQTNIDWLNSYHSFSFGDYYDPSNMHFSFLRVINEDIIAANNGFPMHSHNDMEIITYIISGELTHKDSLGTVDSIKSGEVQLMRAGTGITHSEYNFDKKTPVHLLQIWIIPREKGLPASYQQKDFLNKITPNVLCKIISASKSDDTLHIQQDVEIYAAKFEDSSTTFEIPPKHKIWLQVIKGDLKVNGFNITTGDGIGITDEVNLSIDSTGASEFLLFDFSK